MLRGEGVIKLVKVLLCVWLHLVTEFLVHYVVKEVKEKATLKPVIHVPKVV